MEWRVARIGLKKWTAVAAAATAAAAILAWQAGTALTRGGNGSAVFPAEPGTIAVSIGTGAGMPVAGWFLEGRGNSIVLLLHGIRSDRRQMLARARFLNQAGHAVLLIDLPGHGASPAPAITFGLNESEAVSSSLAWLRRRQPQARVGVIGVSLGAASLVLCRACPRPDAVVLESMYPTIEEAVENRLRMRLGRRLGMLAVPLSRLLLWQLPLRLAIEPEQLRPIDRLAALDMPVLVASGTEDLHTTLAETRRIHAALGAGAQLWEVAGAAHQDLYEYAPAAYALRMTGFLAGTLAPAPGR